MNDNLSPTQFGQMQVPVFKLQSGDRLQRSRHEVVSVGEKRRTARGFKHWVTLKDHHGREYKREWGTYTGIDIHRHLP
jgi:hypothetical protein